MKQDKTEAMQRQFEQKDTDELRRLRERLQERASTKAEMDQISAIDNELHRRAA
jgi:hypothetical protein